MAMVFDGSMTAMIMTQALVRLRLNYETDWMIIVTMKSMKE